MPRKVTLSLNTSEHKTCDWAEGIGRKPSWPHSQNPLASGFAGVRTEITNWVAFGRHDVHGILYRTCFEYQGSAYYGLTGSWAQADATTSPGSIHQEFLKGLCYSRVVGITSNSAISPGTTPCQQITSGFEPPQTGKYQVPAGSDSPLGCANLLSRL